MAVETLLLGIDGATFTILDPLMAEGRMPILSSLVANGVRASLRTVIPALTPPAWTSLITGYGPGEHGIFDFFQKESAEGTSIRFTTSRDVLRPTVWERANQSGKRAIALNFPVTFPAPAIDGYVIPGWMPWRQLRLGCRPSDLYDRVKALPGFDPRDLAMDMAHEEKALEGCPPEEYGDWIDLHIRREERWSEILRMLIDDDPCELVSVVFDGVDKLQHLFWRFLDPVYAQGLKEDWELETREHLLGYFSRLDELLGELTDAVGPDVTIIVASDHGFGAQKRTLFVNGWLARKGYLHWADTVEAPSAEGKVLGVGQIARHTYLLDWRRTRAYAPLPSGNGIHIVRQSDENPGGVAEHEYDSFCESIRAQLLALVDPESGEAVVSQVWRREEIFAGPNLELAPDLTLVLSDGGLISILDHDWDVEPRQQPSGTHQPEGVFVARGPGIRRGMRGEEMSILQVAPLILHSMGVPMPASLAENFPSSLFDSDVAVGETDGTLDPADSAHSNDGETPALDAEAEQAIVQRLRALGYVD